MLNPELVNGPWSHEEDRLLVKLYRQHGSKWSMMSKYFPGRSVYNVKNRWTRHLMLMDLSYMDKAVNGETDKVRGVNYTGCVGGESGPEEERLWMLFEGQLDNGLYAEEGVINW